MIELKPIGGDADYRAALAEAERLLGFERRTPNGERLDVLAAFIDAHEGEHDPMDPPAAIDAIRFRLEQQGVIDGGAAQ